MSGITQITMERRAKATPRLVRRVRAAAHRFAQGRHQAELGAQLRIAGPLMLASLVNMGMAITDVIMMGWIGPVALAAGAVASDFYSLVFYLCAGVLGALSPIVSHARGARQHRLIRRTAQQAFWAVALLAVPGALAALTGLRILELGDNLLDGTIPASAPPDLRRVLAACLGSVTTSKPPCTQ